MHLVQRSSVAGSGSGGPYLPAPSPVSMYCSPDLSTSMACSWLLCSSEEAVRALGLAGRNPGGHHRAPRTLPTLKLPRAYATISSTTSPCAAAAQKERS